ncbi:MAG: SLC13 family permease, partial [Methylocystis sp.]|uniref:SLC13 family permease n=1 Tax=Methylocystis sp. TaxID=1911079 RepID=UPI003D146580
MPSSPQSAPKGARHAVLSFWLGILAAVIVAGGAVLTTAAVLGVGELLSLLSRLPAPTPEAAAVGGIFAATYVVLAIGKLPYYRLDRAGGTLLGASLMIGVGALTLDEAYRSIVFDAITLLLGMMIVVANLRRSGVFRRAADWLA